MSLQKMTATVTIADPEATDGARTVDVVILHGDRLRAELEAAKLNLPALDRAPLNYSTLWVWSALTRTKQYAAPAGKFLKGDCLDLDMSEDVTDEDPTQPEEQSEPPSS